MSADLIHIGQVQGRYSHTQHIWNSRLLGYQVSIYHSGLKEQKLLSAPEKYLLGLKVNLQIQKWNERWNREVSFEDANLRTEEAQQAYKEIENLLTHTLTIDDTIQWHKLKDRKKFTEKNPADYLEDTLNNISKPVKGELVLLPAET